MKSHNDLIQALCKAAERLAQAEQMLQDELAGTGDKLGPPWPGVEEIRQVLSKHGVTLDENGCRVGGQR
jgi:hypothetical protein